MRISDWSSDVCSSDLTSVRIWLSTRVAAAIAPKMTSARKGTQPKTPAAISSVDHAQAPPSCHAHWRRNSPSGGLRRNSGLRSEEHTSELQSLMRISYAVFCLQKKKQLNNKTRQAIQRQNRRETST